MEVVIHITILLVKGNMDVIIILLLHVIMRFNQHVLHFMIVIVQKSKMFNLLIQIYVLLIKTMHNILVMVNVHIMVVLKIMNLIKFHQANQLNLSAHLLLLLCVFNRNKVMALIYKKHIIIFVYIGMIQKPIQVAGLFYIKKLVEDYEM